MNRRDKIRLLQGLVKGITGIADLKPKKFRQVIRPGSSLFYIGDRQVSAEEFHEELKGAAKQGKIKLNVKRI